MFTPKQWLVIFAGGSASAILFGLAALGSFGGILLAYFCQLPLFIIGLSMGTTASVIAGAIAGAGIWILGGLFGVLMFVIFNVAPAVILVRQYLLSRPMGNGQIEWYPCGLLATGGTFIGVGLLAVVFIWFALRAEGTETVIRDYLDQFTDQMLSHLSPSERANIVDSAVPILPGSLGLSWLVMLVINGSLAHSLVARLGWNIRPTLNFVMMELPAYLPIVVAVMLVAAIFLPGTVGYFVSNAAIILALPFFLVGLAVVHLIARRMSAGIMLIIFFYILMFVFGWPVVFIVFLGLIEQLVGLRQRFAPNGTED